MPLRPRSAFALAFGLVVAALAGSCSKDNGTAPNMTVTGPNFSFTFTTAGQSHEFTFPDAGSFGYQCLTHGSSMSGTVNVVAGAADAATVFVGGNNAGTVGNFFSPASVTIKPGGKVTWTLSTSALTNHTATR
jgi:plastocyanin